MKSGATRTAPTLTFAGAAGTVTGSKHSIEVGGRRILLDAGLFQGGRGLRMRNGDPPPFDVKDIDAVVLSHAHLDHSGYLPVLVRNGLSQRLGFEARPARDGECVELSRSTSEGDER